MSGLGHKSKRNYPALLWEEYFTQDYDNVRFSALGLSSLTIPTFHRQNMKINAQKMVDENFQYQPVKKNVLKKSALEYFPPTKQFSKVHQKISEQNLVITAGALNGLSLCMQSLVGYGQEVIMIEPLYPSHFSRFNSRVDIQFKTCRLIYDEKQNTFRMDFDSLKKVLSQKSRVFIICNPANPTGTIWSIKDLQTLTQIIKDYPNLMILQDSAYFVYHSQKKQHIPFGSLSPENFNRSITFYSAGKMFNITGVRVGIGYGPAKLIDLVEDDQYKEGTLASSSDQYIIADDLKSAFEENFYQLQAERHQANYNKTLKKFGELQIPLVDWDGSYYLILNISKYRNRIDEKWFKRLDNGAFEKELDRAFARLMLAEFSVGVIPLSAIFLNYECDTFARLAFNRNPQDLNYMYEAFTKFAEIVKQGPKHNS